MAAYICLTEHSKFAPWYWLSLHHNWVFGSTTVAEKTHPNNESNFHEEDIEVSLTD
jgi:hypothetical protein